MGDDTNTEELKGTAKEVAGKVTGSDELAKEGEAQQEKGEAQQEKAEAEEKAARAEREQERHSGT